MDATMSRAHRSRAAGSTPPADVRELLRLLGTGALDETIARELGLSVRTLHRRITRLQRVLGVRSRFQMGVVAAERGWA